jgi:penicillin-binding protein 1A
MWIDYMRVGLAGVPVRSLPQPPGLVTVRIDPETGLLASGNHPKAIFETFRVENVPQQRVETTLAPALPTAGGVMAAPASQDSGVPEELF